MTNHGVAPHNAGKNPRRHRHYALLAAAGWTVIVGSLLAWDINDTRAMTREFVSNEARANFEKDQAFRRWASSHGGVYVPADERTAPSPYLANLPERDIVTPSGRHLTLMNPAQMLRQISEEYGRQYGVAGHITSLHPLRPENAPDDWERRALESFSQGRAEAREFTRIDGQPYLRLMRPMKSEPSCLACHVSDGFGSDTIAGGVGVAVPMTPFLEKERAQIFKDIASYSLFWMMGLAGIFSGTRRLEKIDDRRRLAEHQTWQGMQQQTIINALLRISLEEGSLDRKLERALDEILATPWLPLQPKGVVFLVEDDPQVLVLKAHRQISESMQKVCERVPFGKCLCGKAAQSGYILSASNVDHRHDNTYEGIMPHGHYNVPIKSGDRVLGVIGLYLDEGHPRSKEEEDFLALAAQTLAGIIEHEKTSQALQQSEERYALAAQGANDGLWDWDLVNNVIYFSPRWKAMLGCADNEIGNDPEEWFKRVHPDDRAQLRLAVQSHLEGTSVHFEHEYRILHRKGDYRWMLSRGFAIQNTTQGESITRMAGSMTDITVRKLAEEEALHNSLHDALTGLANRMLFTDRLHHVLAGSDRSETRKFAVLFLDLDRFKNINDSLGHMIGDRMLIESGKRILACMRPQDTVARFGGDEFALLLEDINNVSEAMLIAERIQDGLSRPFHLDEHTIYTTASIGITFSSAAYSQPEELLRDADTAMYRAKARGKAGYEVFDKTMHTHAVALLGLENDLRHAIERREFLVYYQPVVSLRSGNISGFEALVRWKHPQHGILTPDKFISVAEDTGLITHIGKYVLREACAQLSLWQTTYSMNPPLWISVNLSARELAQPGLVENVREALGQGTLDGSCLRLEITESAVMDDPIGAVNILTRLHELGIHLCIDDFGTGYSSLSYLHRFPIDTLKIDRSFVSGVDGKLANQTITATILALSSGLGLDVVAEGVETPKQLELLRSMKCRYAQGYLFSRPVDANGAARLLSATPAW